jgi:outer membrane autotransporter protein
MKKIALILASVLTSTGAAIAGPYVNVESNASYTGSDYKSRTTDFHVGWEGGNDSFDYYVQGGPAVSAEDGVDSESNLSGKVGVNVAATDKLGLYGEVSVLTNSDDDVDNAWGTKIGAKYSF